MLEVLSCKDHWRSGQVIQFLWQLQKILYTRCHSSTPDFISWRIPDASEAITLTLLGQLSGQAVDAILPWAWSAILKLHVIFTRESLYHKYGTFFYFYPGYQKIGFWSSYETLGWCSYLLYFLKLIWQSGRNNISLLKPKQSTVLHV